MLSPESRLSVYVHGTITHDCMISDVHVIALHYDLIHVYQCVCVRMRVCVRVRVRVRVRVCVYVCCPAELALWLAPVLNADSWACSIPVWHLVMCVCCDSWPTVHCLSP